MEAQAIELHIYSESGGLMAKVRLSQEKYNRTQEAAQKRGETLQEFFNLAVDEYIKRHNIPLEVRNTSNHGKEN